MRRAVTVCVAAALAILSGCGSTTTSTTTVIYRDAPASVAQPLSGLGTAGASTAPGTATSGQQLTDSQFWGLITESHRAAGGDTGRQSDLLRDRLSALPASQIVAFDRSWRQLDRNLYTWDVWGAAYVIEDGCSDDCFRDFRAYVISLGRSAYETARRSPDSLAPMVGDAESGSWEDADNVAPDAYSSATGNDFPTENTDLSGNPQGTAWNDNQVEMLLHRYPRLAAKFRSQ